MPVATNESNQLVVQTRSSGLKFIVSSFGDEIEWTVPSFSVLTVHFVKLRIEINGEKLNGLFNRDDLPKLDQNSTPCEGLCHSHCQISIDGTEYTVLWKWELFQEMLDDGDSDSETISEISETDMSDISIGDINLGDNISDSETDDSDINIVHHTLPFKVMGVAHSNQSQTHLLRANIKINEEHEVVTAHLVPEPQNERDSDAISVQINYGDGPCHVGYIPRELTKYIHPLLKENAITKVDIGHIIFSLKWYRVGFYMKIPITRVGRWEPYVVSKAMRVK